MTAQGHFPHTTILFPWIPRFLRGHSSSLWQSMTAVLNAMACQRHRIPMGLSPKAQEVLLFQPLDSLRVEPRSTQTGAVPEWARGL